MSNGLNLEDAIAIVGMAGRFPGASNLQQFWENLRQGKESIRFFSPEELQAAGVHPDLIKHPDYVPAMGILDNSTGFDAELFGFSPREAEITDPQQRLFLECAWEALESAGYDPKNCPGTVGVFGGVRGAYTYFQHFVAPQLETLRQQIGDYPLTIGNDKDFIATRVAYKLNLKGPAVTVQTACSTSLVAIVMACQSLLDYQSDMVLAGGASIMYPEKTGYLYQEGMILSPDGHCRSFDADAGGTVGGNGVGIVVLKRLADALADNSPVLAVIRGAAINNDGSQKVGYTAPSVEGQAKVIAEAQALAEVEPESISYIETHGTGTPLGDPIEIAALSQVFQSAGAAKQFCAIGSVKSNIGHLDAAAGVTGVIKTVLALQHQQIPPSLHFKTPNPKLKLENSPFFVNDRLRDWQAVSGSRRAGVSSFGIGGTNAHLVLEEAPSFTALPAPPGPHLLVLSAQSPAALSQLRQRWQQHLSANPELNPADIAYTSQLGRHHFSLRCCFAYQNTAELAAALDVEPLSAKASENAPCVFLFTGQGSQYLGMGRTLYQEQAIFRAAMDRCAIYLRTEWGFDLRALLYPDLVAPDANCPESAALSQTRYAQGALFSLEYALSQLFLSWGIKPQAMIGHSLGEYVAACLAGVFDLETALHLIAARGRLMQAMPAGDMLVVPLSADSLREQLPATLDLAAINAPQMCVVSGPSDAVQAFAEQLQQQDINPHILQTSHAFHSAMMEPMLKEYTELLRSVRLKAPNLRYLSNISGTWISAEQATDPSYWAQQIRQPVRFSDSVNEVSASLGPQTIWLELGPGHTLSSLVMRHPSVAAQQCLHALPGVQQAQELGPQHNLQTLGRLWTLGAKVDWETLYVGQQRRRLSLPTYPFQHQTYQLSAPMPKCRGFSQAQTWDSLLAQALRDSRHKPSALLSAKYQAKQHYLDKLCQAYLNLALRSRGLFANAEQTHSAEECMAAMPAQWAQLSQRWLENLLAAGELSYAGDGLYSHLSPCSPRRLEDLTALAQRAWDDEPAYLARIIRCGSQLPSLLNGEKTAHELLFPEHSAAEFSDIRQASALADYLHKILQSFGAKLGEMSGAGLRILEIGAGAGIATQALLPALPAERCRYSLTDLDADCLAAAKAGFQHYDFIDYLTLDIEQSPEAQQFQAHSQDVIVALNVLHTTQNIASALRHTRRLLAAGGVLMLGEITEAMADFDVVDGLLMPRFEDGERDQGHPFLNAKQWEGALLAAGFREVMVFPAEPIGGMQLLLAWADEQGADAQPQAFYAPQRSISAQTSSNNASAHAQSNAADPLSAEISALWRTALGLEHIDPDADFFALGGDSLIAVQLTAALRRHFQLDLAPHHLLAAPNVTALAAYIRSLRGNTAPQTAACLVPLQSGKAERPPLFLIHPAGGQVFFYRDLVNSLPDDYPVFGLQADAAALATADLPGMASYYLEAIRQQQPHGPYYLGGASFGGIVAYEIAQQLQAEDEDVPVLLMIDSPSPGHMPTQIIDDSELLAYLLEVSTEQPISAEELRQLTQPERLKLAMQAFQRDANWDLPEQDIEYFQQFLDTFKLNVHHMLAYAAAPWPGEVLFFKASEHHPRNPRSPEQGWQALVGTLHVHETPGNHISMNYHPQVAQIGRLLTDYLQRK